MSPREKFLCQSLNIARDQLASLTTVIEAYDARLSIPAAKGLIEASKVYQSQITAALDQVGFNPYEKETA